MSDAAFDPNDVESTDVVADAPGGTDLDETVDGPAAALVDEDSDVVVEPEADEDVDPDLAAFRTHLASLEGSWYVVQTYSGMENRVRTNLEVRVKNLDMGDRIYEVVVPTEEVVELKNGARKRVRRNRFPGYVLVRMDMDESSWQVVRQTPAVAGFVGNAVNPVPLTLSEVEVWMAPVAAARPTDDATDQTRPTADVSDYQIDQVVLIVDGSFATLKAKISEIKPDQQKVKALVEIFGRETPVDLGFDQIKPMD